MKILIIDGNSLANRAYFALSKSNGGLRSKDGAPITICSGFISMMARLISQYEYTHIAIAFDPGDKTFRHEIYPEYKAGRTQKPDDFQPDFALLKHLLDLTGVRIFCVSNFEADDVIGTITTLVPYRTDVRIYSSDKDLYQLVDDNFPISVVNLDGEIIDESKVKEDMGVVPIQVPSYKALCGDKSDNIPGGKGIGKVATLKLLADNSGIEMIFSRISSEQDTSKELSKVKASKDLIDMSYQLAKIRCYVPLNFDINDCQLSKISVSAVDQLASKLGLNGEFNQFQKALNKPGDFRRNDS